MEDENLHAKVMEDSKTKREFDDILREIGEFGRYQKILYFGTCLLIVPVALQIAILVFATGSPNYHCQSFAAQNGSTSNASAVVKPNTCYSNCSRYSFDGPFTSIVSEWNLICDRRHYSALSQSLFMAGMLIGSIVFGSTSDWFGRKPTLFVTTLITVIFSVGSSFANSLALFMALRFFVGGTATGMMLASYVYYLEVVGPGKRTLAGKVQDFFWAGTGMFVALLGYLIREWRYSLLAASLPGALFLPFCRVYPESTRWLVAKNRLDEAQQTLERYDKKRLIDREKLKSMLTEVKSFQDELNTSGKRKPNLFDLVRGPRMRKITLISCFNWFVTSLGFYGLMVNVPNLHGDLYINFFISFLIEIPSTPISWFLLQRYGRRIPYVTFICIGGLVMLLVLAVPNTAENGPIITTMAMVGKFCVAMSFSSIYIYTSELYPTVIRNLGLGTSSVCARVGSIVAPYIVMMAQLPSLNDETVPLVIMGILCLVAGCTAYFLPETLNCNMPQTLEEVETMQENFEIRCFKKKQFDLETVKDKVPVEGVKTEEKDGLLETSKV